MRKVLGHNFMNNFDGVAGGLRGEAVGFVLPRFFEGKRGCFKRSVVEVFASSHCSLDSTEVERPAGEVVRLDQPTPFLRCVVDHLALWPPEGHLVACVPLVVVLLGCVVTSPFACIVDPTSQQKEFAGPKKTVQVVNHFDHHLRGFLADCLVFAVVRSSVVDVQNREKVGKRLSGHIHQIVLVGLLVGEGIARREQRFERLLHLCWVVEDVGWHEPGVVQVHCGAKRDDVFGHTHLLRSVSGVDCLVKQFPCTQTSLMNTPIATDGVLMRPDCHVVMWRLPPDVLQHKLVDSVVLKGSLHCDAEAGDGGLLEVVLLRCFVDVVEFAVETGVASVVVKHVPDEGFAVVRFKALELRAVFRVKVEDEHVVVGDGGEVCLGLFGGPELRGIDEEPALHDPYGIRVAFDKGVVHSLPGGNEEGVVVAGRVHLVVLIGVVEFACRVVSLMVLLHKGLPNLDKHRIRRVQIKHTAVLLGKASPIVRSSESDVRVFQGQSFGDVPRESREYWGHVKLLHPSEEAHLKVLSCDNEVLRERPAPALQVAHALPCEEGGAREEGCQVVVGQAKLSKGLLPDVLLSGEGEWQVDSVHRHPVELLLPAFPCPPGHSVADGADVLVVSPFVGACHLDVLGNAWGVVRDVEVAARPGADLHLGDVRKVVVEARGNAPDGAALDHLAVVFVTLCKNRKVVRSISRRHHTPNKLTRALTKDPLKEIINRCSRGVQCCQNDSRKRKTHF